MCRDRHRQLHKGKVFPKTLCLGNLSIKWVSKKDFTYACELLEVCFHVLSCFFSRESQSHLTSLTPREGLSTPLERVVLAQLVGGHRMSSADLLMFWVKELIHLMVANSRNAETGPVVEHFAITHPHNLVCTLHFPKSWLLSPPSAL